MIYLLSEGCVSKCRVSFTSLERKSSKKNLSKRIIERGKSYLPLALAFFTKDELRFFPMFCRLDHYKRQAYA